MRRGEVWWVDLDPVRTGEANKVRPCVVVSNDANNVMARRLGRGVVTVVTVTSNAERVFAFQVLVPAGAAGLPRDSKIQAELLDVHLPCQLYFFEDSRLLLLLTRVRGLEPMEVRFFAGATLAPAPVAFIAISLALFL